MQNRPEGMDLGARSDPAPGKQRFFNFFIKNVVFEIKLLSKTIFNANYHSFGRYNPWNMIDLCRTYDQQSFNLIKITAQTHENDTSEIK